MASVLVSLVGAHDDDAAFVGAAECDGSRVGADVVRAGPGGELVVVAGVGLRPYAADVVLGVGVGVWRCGR